MVVKYHSVLSPGIQLWLPSTPGQFSWEPNCLLDPTLIFLNFFINSRKYTVVYISQCIFSSIKFSLTCTPRKIFMGVKLFIATPGGYSHFFFIRRLGPSIYRSPPNNIRNFKHPKKYLKFWATQILSPILYLDLKKDPKMHRNG